LTLQERLKVWREQKRFRYEYRTVEEYSNTRKNKLPEGFELIVIQNVHSTTLNNLKEKIWEFQKSRLTISEKH
jgi:hypothetical protein